MAKKRTGSPRSADVVLSLDESRLVSDLCEGIGGEFGTSLSARIRQVGLVGGINPGFTVDPRSYVCADSFRRDYQLAEMLSKFDPGSKSEAEARYSRAIDRFYEAEELCRQTNARLLHPSRDTFSTGVTVHSVIFTARNKILGLLGEQPDMDEVAVGFGFGPGASTRVPRREADAWYKFQGEPETTSSNTVFVDAIFSHHPGWKASILKLQDEPSEPYSLALANRVITVPKNAKTDRIIAIEPCLNMFVQKGFGRVLRLALKRVGVNLDDQSWNQDLAFWGSVTNELATIDLSMASDTVSRQLVHELFPPAWVSAFEQCRTPYGRLASGELITYQKFSSMGNGMTFELESMIFYALCSAVIELAGEKDRRLAIYGDDIVCSTRMVDPILEVLSYCGFLPNEKKTHVDGPFRESCGKHWFRGVDVTPFYVRRPLTRLSDLFLLHNNAWRWAWNGLSYDEALRPAIGKIRQAAPKSWRKPRLPDSVYGDGAFIGFFDECTPRRAPRPGQTKTRNKPEGFEGWVIPILHKQAQTFQGDGDAALLKSLYTLEKSTGPFQDGASWFGGEQRYRVTLDAEAYEVARLDSYRFEALAVEISRVNAGGFRARVIDILVPQWDDKGRWC